MRSFEPATQKGYVSISCYRVGALAVHRRPWDMLNLWYVSHAATGMAVPGVELARLRDARQVATAIDAAVNWTAMTRGPAPCEVVGLTTEMKIAAREARDAALEAVGAPLPAPLVLGRAG